MALSGLEQKEPWLVIEAVPTVSHVSIVITVVCMDIFVCFESISLWQLHSLCVLMKGEKRTEDSTYSYLHPSEFFPALVPIRTFYSNFRRSVSLTARTLNICRKKQPKKTIRTTSSVRHLRQQETHGTERLQTPISVDSCHQANTNKRYGQAEAHKALNRDNNPPNTLRWTAKGFKLLADDPEI